MAGVTITLREHVAAPAAVVFKFMTASDVLPKILLGYGPLPGVVSTSGNVGAWHVPGSFRFVQLTNGSSAREELTAYQPPNYFAYRTSGFTSVLNYFVLHGRGQWWFTPEGQGTQVTWTYAFTARARFMRPLLRVFVALLWRGYMRGALRQMRVQTERQHAAPRA